LEKRFGHRPRTFKSLEEAGDELGRCAIAFVDLFLKDVADQDIFDLHKKHAKQYRLDFHHADEMWPKLVVLISTRMPEDGELRSFREGAGIRSAFFRPIEKRLLEHDNKEVDRVLDSWAIKYASFASLNRYLNYLTDVVSAASERVVSDIDKIELHDLAVLDATRLLAENTTLHAYLSWLTSELLAARARDMASTKAGARDGRAAPTFPDRVIDGAIDTKNIHHSALFDLFADVTSAPGESNGHLQFGEIVAESAQVLSDAFKVFIALSPACDLARCPADYEVLLLQGDLSKSLRSADSLLELSTSFGQGSHLLNYRAGAEQRQGVIRWEFKNLKTRPAGELANLERYVRIGRMAELFAYEVKEKALSNLSRIGLPVTPSIQLAASVHVLAKFNGGKGIEPLILNAPAPGRPAVCALVAKGRIAQGKDDTEMVMLTEQFREWFTEEVQPHLLACDGAIKPRVEAVLGELAKWSEWRVALDKGTGKTGFADFVVKKVSGDIPQGAHSGIEVYIVPEVPAEAEALARNITTAA
jgi:hypothetical protein